MPQIEGAHYKIALMMDSTAQTFQLMQEANPYKKCHFCWDGRKRHCQQNYK